VTNENKPRLSELHEALEASWDTSTSYGGISEPGNPACGQCYPSAWVVQHFFPQMDIIEGEVWTGQSLEKHSWNVVVASGCECHLDLTWQQFRAGSVVRGFKIRDRNTLGDTPATIARCEPLRDRVVKYLSVPSGGLRARCEQVTEF
jgi:hypothetical protein